MTMSSKVSKLRYLSMYTFTVGPNFLNRMPTRKNLAPLPTIEAPINGRIEIFETPAVTVKILYGIGVKAAEKIIVNEFSSYA